MTKYKLPAEKKQSKETEAVRPGAEYQRHVTLPANDAMVKECKVGESVRIILEAKIEGLRSEDGNDYSDRSISINMDTIEVTKPDVEADIESGYRQVAGRS